MSEWNIQTKVVAIIIDNTANAISAVTKLGLTHFHCFVQTVSLVVNGAIHAVKRVEDVKKKVKNIVTPFHCSVKSTDHLEELQVKEGKVTRRLIQEVETRWNSTYYMLQRYLELEECKPVTTVLWHAHRFDMCFISRRQHPRSNDRHSFRTFPSCHVWIQQREIHHAF